MLKAIFICFSADGRRGHNEKVASFFKKKKEFKSIKNRKSKVKNRSSIYDQNGAEMAKIDTLFMMAEKPYPLGSHIPIDRQTERQTDRQTG